MSGKTPTLCPSGSHKKLDDSNGDDADSFASCQSNLLFLPNPPLVQLIPRELSVPRARFCNSLMFDV